MRMLLAVVATAAAVVHTAAGAPRPRTIYASPGGRIEAFAQDGNLLAWFSSTGTGCNSVWVYSLVDGVRLRLPLQGPHDPNVTCRWPVVPPVHLALAGPTALWTLRETAPLRFDYVLGAGVGNRTERRFQEIAHGRRGAGLWLGGIAGDRGTLVYALTAVTYVDEVACLSNPRVKGACALERSGGGVYRVVGRTPKPVPDTPASVFVAAAEGRIADVPTASLAHDGRPLAGPRQPVEVRNAVHGSLLCTVRPKGAPLAVALSATTLATLEQSRLGLRLAWYAASSCAPRGSTPIAATATHELSTSGRLIVFRVGRSIRVVDTDTHAVRTVARADATPIGLSVEDTRIAWGENVRGRGRIRELLVRLPS